MNVKEKFIELTSKTYPHGYENELFSLLPSYLKEDKFGNLFYQVGESPSTMFTCHLDTASHKQDIVKHTFKDNIISTDGTSILGADDKAGVVVLLYMMEHNIPGLYYFFLGEERGCIGSRKLSETHKNNPLPNIKKVISFDRRGKDSVITHQMGMRCCSQSFAEEVSNKLNQFSRDFDQPFSYYPDSTGIYTDSAQFTSIYSECTNISVGYQNEHTTYESQDIDHLEKLCRVVVKIDWEGIGSYRNQTINYSTYYEDSDLDFGHTNYSRFNYDDYTDDKKEKTLTIKDPHYFDFESTVTYDVNTLDLCKVKLHQSRLMNEKYKILNLLDSLEVEYDNVKWDGNILAINKEKFNDITLNRRELSDYLPEINDWITSYIKYNDEYGI